MFLVSLLFFGDIVLGMLIPAQSITKTLPHLQLFLLRSTNLKLFKDATKYEIGEQVVLSWKMLVVVLES